MALLVWGEKSWRIGLEKKMRHATRATMYDNMAQLDPPKGTGVVPENRFVEQTIK